MIAWSSKCQPRAWHACRTSGRASGIMAWVTGMEGDREMGTENAARKARGG